MRPKDEKAELWEGARSGIQAAEDVFNADTAGDVNAISRILPEILARAHNVYTDLPNSLISRNTVNRFLAGQDPARTGGIARLFREASSSLDRKSTRLNSSHWE